jgi:hypothetical protein
MSRKGERKGHRVTKANVRTLRRNSDSIVFIAVDILLESEVSMADIAIHFDFHLPSGIRQFPSDGKPIFFRGLGCD